MAYWLLKTEPTCYAWEDLVRDKSAVWDGITNALALKHLRTMKKGDLVLVYHTGGERAAVGVGEVCSEPYPDPRQDDERHAVVDLRPKRRLPRPVTLSDVKADPAFAGWEFLRNGRLSVVPVPEAMWGRILALSQRGEQPAGEVKLRPTASSPRRPRRMMKGSKA